MFDRYGVCSTRDQGDNRTMPQIDRADELKRESMKQLRASVPTEQFIDRPESESDKGVDLTLEAVIHQQPTNLRSHVQLKSTDKTVLNSDGSFSLSIQTDNLRYLLSGSCPLYVLWLSGSHELRYAWARDEAKRLYSESPKWEQQGTVTIRFAEQLDTEAWNAIHARVIAEGRAACVQNNYFATVGSTECAPFAINPVTLDVLTPQDALALVKTHGISATSNGYPAIVRRCAQLLPNEQLNDPCVQLSLGYASYVLGEHFACRGHLARVLPHRDSLPDFEKFFLNSLLNECRLRFGQIGDEEYTSAQREVEANAPHFLALQLRLERVRWEHLSEHDPHKRRDLYKALSDAESEIQKTPGASESVKLQAAIVRLNAEIVDANIGYVEVVVAMSARIQMSKNPLTPHLAKLFEDATAAESHVASETERLVQRARSTDNPVLIAEAILTQCIYRTGQILQKPILLKLVSGQQKVIPIEMVNLVLSQLSQAIAIFRSAGAVESTVRATLMQAQLHSNLVRANMILRKHS